MILVLFCGFFGSLPVILKHFCQPVGEAQFFAFFDPHKVIIAGDQAFGSGQTDEIFGRLDFFFKIFGLGFQMLGRCTGPIKFFVADEGASRLGYAVNQTVDGLFEFLGAGVVLSVSWTHAQPQN